MMRPGKLRPTETNAPQEKVLAQAAEQRLPLFPSQMIYAVE